MLMDLKRDPDLEWLDHVQPIGLVVASAVLRELGLSPVHQSAVDTEVVTELIEAKEDKPALRNPWTFMERVLGWEARHVAGAPGGSALPSDLAVSVPEHDTVLQPTWAVAEPGDGNTEWQLLVRIEAPGIDPDARGALEGWEATPQQRFERLLRETGVFAGLMITDNGLRIVYAPTGETSGHLTFPLRSLGTVAGRPMLGGLKLLLDSFRLFSDADHRRLPELLKRSRDAQASVSAELAGQVLGALHELLRGLGAAEPAMIRELAKSRPGHLYEGLLAVLMRLVFVLYAEDRDLLPSRSDIRAREIYETSYSVRGLYARLVEDAALYPDTMDERRGGWGRLLALFRLIHKGHDSGFVQRRGGKLFDPEEFPFLEGRAAKDELVRILPVSDGCLLRILEGLMTLKPRGGERERLSYRALDVQQIGSVYETVMGFTVLPASGPSIAIRAGKNNRTPVFVDLDELLNRKGKDRLKHLKENTGRGSFSTTVENAIQAAQSVDDLAAALDPVVDDRGSPRHSVATAGMPLLQPTDERRRTGSHYTPRSLTEPIVRYALEPAFERLGADATLEQVLELKVCDPAMGSGAFLVEACRALGNRVVQAWAKHRDKKPAIPADEDEQLHARRLVAQRCLYGVDKNPRAVDLARLSLWLATLARDHEFTFLDHALKCGDSLVGLTAAQIGAAHWDDSKPGLPLFRKLVKDKVAEATKARAEIQAAPDDTMRAVQEARYKTLESSLVPVRTIGDAVISAFFAADKPKVRESKRAEVESLLTGSLQPRWDKLQLAASSIRDVEPSVLPFHWELEFPEVFERENSGFDAIVGNPPFAGKNTIIGSHRKNYLLWLQNLHDGAHGNADLVAHFFRRAFGLLRRGAVSGLIATNTIGQGDTRASGLTAILGQGGAILRATKRLKWPGEAAVVVSVAHVRKGSVQRPVLDGKEVQRISAYLVEGDLDTSPATLVANAGKAFVGSYVLGRGFTFDNDAAANGEAESLETMRALIAKDPRNAGRIFPFIGGDEVNTDPSHAYHRYVIDFFDRPLRRDGSLKSWETMTNAEKARCRAHGIVPGDYLDEVAEDWPDLIEILRRRVKPERDKQKRPALKTRWWQYAEKRPGLYKAISPLNRVFVNSSKAAPQYAIAMLNKGLVYSQNLNVFAVSGFGFFAVLQSTVHETWARFVGTTFEDRLTYVKEDCFESFPFLGDFENDARLEVVGEAYHAFRAQLMIGRNQGLTKIYNRFHARGENAPDIVRLRALHAEMDQTVLRAYGWHDLADRSTPEFIEQDADEGKTPKTRLDWPAEFKDEVISRLLALNAERAAEGRVASLVAVPDETDAAMEEG
jgi:hypothetical protein